jgi:hypothetical protein
MPHCNSKSPCRCQKVAVLCTDCGQMLAHYANQRNQKSFMTLDRTHIMVVRKLSK